MAHWTPLNRQTTAALERARAHLQLIFRLKGTESLMNCFQDKSPSETLTVSSGLVMNCISMLGAEENESTRKKTHAVPLSTDDTEKTQCHLCKHCTRN
jgi:hypothetical protein